MAELDEAIESAEAHRAEAETRAEELALLLIASLLSGSETDDEQVGRLADLAASAAVASVLALVWSQLGASDTLDRLPVGAKPQTMMGDSLARDAVESAVQVTADRLEDRMREVASTVQSISPEMTQADRRTVAKSLGTTIATEATANAAIVMAPVVSKILETTMRKMWISRGDSRVRSSHRLLHSQTADIDDDFKPGLRYPGDPLAPLEERINCRCGLFLIEDEKAAQAEDVFSMTDKEFETPLAASAAREIIRSVSHVRRHPVADQALEALSWE